MTTSVRMPAEWEPHRATWIAWPHHAPDWPGKFAAIPWVFAEIIRHLVRSETVCIIVDDDKMEQRVKRVLRKAGAPLPRIDFFHVPTDRVWTRDYCPIFVADQAGGAVEALSACNDHVSAAGWQSVGSSLVEMELPPEFVSAGQTSQSASWNGPSGSIRAASYRGDSPHMGIYGTITSECDIFISGAPAHVDLVSGYGRSVHVIVRPQDAPAMIIEGQAKTIAGQAQLLHAIRYARVSAAWGHKY